MSLTQDKPKAAPKQRNYVCQLCGKDEPKNGPNQKVCIDCRSQRDKAFQIARYVVTVGSERACSTCGAAFIVSSVGGQTRCDACKAPRVPSVPICVECRQAYVQTSHRQKYCAGCRHVRVQKNKKAEYLRERDKPGYKAKASARSTRILTKRYREDPSFAISVRVRVAMNQSLDGKKAGRSWESLVGYTLAELMRHLERQFVKGMSWDNRSKWHIDHVVPLAAHTFTSAEDPEFKAAWALTNLRPAWAKDNWTKRDKRLFLL